MTDQICIVIAQLNFTVGDIVGNARLIIDASSKAKQQHNADAIVFPELALTSYPPEDLLMRPAFRDQVRDGLEIIKREQIGIDIILGYPHYENSNLYNAACVVRNGNIIATYFKQQLPNYSVFDEKRYFVAGDKPCVINIKNIAVGITICEDAWQYGSIDQAVKAGAKLILNLNASPFHFKKGEDRAQMLRQCTQESSVPIVYVNLIGGQDELVFDGDSMVMNAKGTVTQRVPSFVESLEPVKFKLDAEKNVTPLDGTVSQTMGEEESIYKAIVLGVRDYIEKNGFKGVVIGLSGGIDSALTLAIAVDAIGCDRVEGVLMPSRYTADMSIEDAKIESEALGVKYQIIPIEAAFEVFLDSLKDEFAGTEPDSAEENIQARCRGIILMAISNKKRKILLTTGNKSELSVGYATLYGDMAGGFAPLKDVPKQMVYRLANYRNQINSVIPNRVLERPPSAELAPDQKDEDTLPPYSILDPILEMYIERDMGLDEVVALGFEEATVKRVIAMVNRNEYKRRQAPPGVRITQRAFGRDRRYPITSKFF